MKETVKNTLKPLSSMLVLSCVSVLTAAGAIPLADAAITAAALIAFLALRFLSGRYVAWLNWIGEALFCGVGFYVSAQVLSLGEFTWTSTADGPLHELGALWIAAIYAVFYALGHSRFAVCATGALMLIFGCANFALEQFRGRPFLLIDLGSLGTAINVSGSYSLELDAVFITGIVYTLAFAVLSWTLFPGARMGRLCNLAGRLLPIATACVYVYLCFYSGLMYRNGIYMNWNDNEFRSSSVMYLLATASTLDIAEPDGYSEDALDGIVLHLMDNAGEENAYYAATDDGSDPDIIVVMSESFSDTRELGEFKTDSEFFSFFDELSNESIHGHVYSSVIGGNTANSEYEFLTGDTCAFLPTGSVAYQTYINYPVGTLVSTLEGHGYSSAVFHPHWASGWNRVQVYGLFGFDRTLWRDDFRTVSTLRGYTTDRWNYDHLIELYEEQRAAQSDDKGVFIFNITMQNHGGYTTRGFQSDVHISGYEGQFPVTEQYLSLIRLTNEETQALIDYFRGVDREVIILFFGDHQPKLEKEFYDLVYGHDTTNLQLSEFQRQYITPFYIWSNKGLEARDEGYTSINYLSQLLLETAGLENTPYGYFLSDLQEDWPVINANGAMDSDGDWHYLSDEEFTGDPDIAVYKILQFNRLFDPGEYRDEIYQLVS